MLLRQLPELPSEACGVYLTRFEASASGTRSRSVLRAWRSNLAPTLRIEGDDATSAYAGLRAGLALTKLRPTAREARDLFIQSWTAQPGLPEAGLRLARWWIEAGDIGRALSIARMADVVQEGLAKAPQPAGAGSWLIPAQLALWLRDRDARAAEGLARQAMDRTPTPAVVNALRTITQVHTVPAQGA